MTSIKECAFTGCKSLIGIKIPKSVVSIGDGAFGGCTSLSSVEISDGVTIIGGSAFKDCTSLRRIDIPNSVREIGPDSFPNTLKELHLHQAYPEKIKAFSKIIDGPAQCTLFVPLCSDDNYRENIEYQRFKEIIGGDSYGQSSRRNSYYARSGRGRGHARTGKGCMLYIVCLLLIILFACVLV